MEAALERTIDPYVRMGLELVQEILGDHHPRDFAVRLWEGTTWEPEPGLPARFTLVLKHPGALRRMFWQPSSLTLGEAFIYDDFDIEGDIEHVFEVGEYLVSRRFATTAKMRKAGLLLRLPAGRRGLGGRKAARLSGRRHCKERDREAVRYHYDVSNDFYSLWLGERMVYSCAYFAHPDDSLDTAQARKLDYICKKLRLVPGERLLDLGCGWGGLILYAAQEYGVRAVGITLSEPQAALANERIAAAGLADSCRAEVLDYREIDEPEGFDKLVSVGMFEHVGEALLPDYFARAWRLLRPGGVFLNHGIARADDAAARIRGRPLGVDRGPTFNDEYVFPDGELVPINATLRSAEEAGFEVRDLESLREHYALTLRCWVRNLEDRRAQALRATDETTYRIWRLFMSASAHGFAVGDMGVYQALLVKPDEGASGMPLTREDWYGRAGSRPG